MYVKCLDERVLKEMFAGSNYDVVWARPYFHKFKRSTIDSVEEFVHSDVNFKLNCPLGGAVRALLSDKAGNFYIVNFYDYSADVLDDANSEICQIYIQKMTKKFGAEYVHNCKENNHNIDDLRKRFVERYGKRSTINSDIIIKIPLKKAPNFDWARGCDATDATKLVEHFSQNLSVLNRKLEMQFSLKDYIR